MLSRTNIIVSLILIFAGLATFVWKVVFLELPVLPSQAEDVWRVELIINLRGQGRRGSVQAALPSPGPGQVIFDEIASSDQLTFSIRNDKGRRTGVWSGRLSGSHEIVYAFRADLSETTIHVPNDSTPTSKDMLEKWGEATAEFPSQAPEIIELLETLDLDETSSPSDRARVLLSFVTDEIEAASNGSEDALLTLATRDGAPEGRVRLLIAGLRAAGVAARPAVGLRVGTGEPQRESWVEAWLQDRWVPLSPLRGTFGVKPADLVLLHTGSLVIIEATGVEAVTHRFRALREHLRPDELAAMMLPTSPLLAEMSLYKLPVDAQAALRGLLLLPLGALVTAIFRNLIGVPSFGTFMPVLLAFALRYSDLGPGLLMIAGVLLLGIVGRLGLDRLRLLLVPRLSILLCLVVLVVMGMALMGRGLDSRDFTTGVLLPTVILTMLVERFSITIAEEGIRAALVRAGFSTLVAVAVYPVFRSQFAEQLMFGFPELIFVVMGLLVAIGGYTGYRVSDLIRFRSFASEAEDAR